jgi:hypothetical protein
MEINVIDLAKCRPFKDFGKGFYTTPLPEQAIAMAKRTVRIYRNGSPCVTEFYFDEKWLHSNEYKIKNFKEPNADWAKFIVNNCNPHFKNISDPECNMDCKYDVVIGPVANDDIAALIDVYLAGILSDEALIKELTFRDLSEQLSFHTVKGISLLKKSGIKHG